jgi:hypothetical protein
MALSDRLTELAKRAKEADDRSRAAANEAREQLRSEVERASESARKQADELAQRSAAAQAKASDWWGQVQNDWAKHVATVRDNLKSFKAEQDSDMAQVDADLATADANAPVDFA